MKNTKKLNSLTSIILGTLLFIISLSNLASDNKFTVTKGVFALLVGIAYILIGFIYIMGFDDKSVFVKNLLKTLAYSCYAFYFVMFDLFDIISNNTKYYATVGWIMLVLHALSSVAVITFSVLDLFKDNEKLENGLDISLSILVCSLVLKMVFTTSGNQNVIGNISIASVVMLICYIYITMSKTKKSLITFANDLIKDNNSENIKQTDVDDNSQQNDTMIQ